MLGLLVEFHCIGVEVEEGESCFAHHTLLHLQLTAPIPHQKGIV